MVAFFAFIKAAFLPTLGFAFSVALEQALYRLDRIFMPVWRTAMLFVVALLARVTWLCWQAMAPIDSLLSYGGPESTNLLVSIVAFSMVVGALACYLGWSGLKLLLRDGRAGNLSKPVEAARYAALAVAALLCVAFLFDLYLSPLVEGKSLWSVLCGE